MSILIHMADGRVHYLDAEDEARNTFDIVTLAHHLALINRFTGATRRPYSVAEHSLLCADIAHELNMPVRVELACLMHDAHEAIVGDASTPAKMALGPAWREFEDRQARTLQAHFGLLGTFIAHESEIKAVDLIALATERRDLLSYDRKRHPTWPQLDTPGRTVWPASMDLCEPARIEATWYDWKTAFIARFHDLYRKVYDSARPLPSAPQKAAPP